MTSDEELAKIIQKYHGEDAIEAVIAQNQIITELPSFFPQPLNVNSDQVDEFLRKVSKWQRYIAKVQRMVRDIEGNTQKLPSIADCWKWQKGLLHDFMLAKKHVERSPSNMAE